MPLNVRQYLTWTIRALAAALVLTTLFLACTVPAAILALDKCFTPFVTLTEYLPYTVILLIIFRLFIKSGTLSIAAAAIVLAFFINYRQHLGREQYLQKDYLPKHGNSFFLAEIAQNFKKQAVKDNFGTFLFLRQYLRGADVYIARHGPNPIGVERGRILSGIKNLLIEDFDGVCDKGEAARTVNDESIRKYALTYASVYVIPSEQKSYRMCSSEQIVIFKPHGQNQHIYDAK
jgi:hypothetical protein